MIRRSSIYIGVFNLITTIWLPWRYDCAGVVARTPLQGSQLRMLIAISPQYNIAAQEYNEAFMCFCDIEMQWDPTAPLLNAKAAANMQRGNFQDTHEDLSKALEMPRSGDLDKDTLVRDFHGEFMSSSPSTTNGT